MHDEDNVYLALLAVFVPFSLVAIGGGPAIFAPMQKVAVDVRHWLSAREFIELFAVARVSPGPGSMLSTLIGYKLAGWGGALVATFAMFAPSSILCVLFARVWDRHRGKRWHDALQSGLAPVGAGLMFAGALAILRLGEPGLLPWAVAALVAGLLSWKPRAHPFIMLFIGAGVFALAALAGLH